MLFIVGGVGVTPVKAMLERLDRRNEPIALYRASRNDDLIYVNELREMAQGLGGQLMTLVGPTATLAVKDPFSGKVLGQSDSRSHRSRCVAVRTRAFAVGRSRRPPRGRARSPTTSISSSPGGDPMTDRPSPSLGRRLLPALVLTSAAAGLVALLDRPSGGSADGLAAGLGGDGTAPAATGSTATAPTSSAAPTVTTLPTVSSTNPAVVDQPAATTAAPSTTQLPSAGSSCEGKTVDGPTIDTRWGPVQVEAVVSSTGQICDVDAIQSPSDHRRSVIDQPRALPILHTEVMDAQSTNINGVSGATVTSVGYVKSLQAILDGVGG